MEDCFSNPIRARVDSSLHSTYELPYRIHCAIAYPIVYPNESSIVVIAHDSGLTFLWRRAQSRPQRQKRSQYASVKPTANIAARNSTSTKDDDVDEQDDEDNEDDDVGELDEIEGRLPSAAVTASLTAHLDAPTLQVSACHLPRYASLQHTEHVPPLLRANIVVAANCEDGSTRLLVVPMKPPQESEITLRRRKSAGSLRQIILSSTSIPRSCLPQALAMSYSGPESSSRPDEGSVGDAMDVDTDPAKSHDHSQQANDSWNLKVVSHSPEPNPMLHIWHLALNDHADDFSSFAQKDSILRSIHIPSICSSIAFSPSSYPSRRHKQLLLVDATATVRICEITDAFTSPNWLVSLVPPLQDFSTLSHSSSTKINRVLDAQWGLSGRVVVVLLRDGRWGIWDLEGVRPLLQGGKSSAAVRLPGLRGGGIAQFSLSGYVGDAQSGRPRTSLDSDHSAKSKTSSTLAPMTPNTRKMKQGDLFAAPPPPLPRKKTDFITGLIALTDVNDHSNGTTDDSLLLMYNFTFYRITGLMKYWQDATRIDERHGISSSGITAPGRRIKQSLPIDVGGELVTSLKQFTDVSNASRNGQQSHLRPNVLLSTEHRLILVHPSEDSGLEAPSRKSHQPRKERPDLGKVDQELLVRGELGLDGVDRLLDGMANGEKDLGLFGQNVVKRRVEFATNH